VPPIALLQITGSDRAHKICRCCRISWGRLSGTNPYNPQDSNDHNNRSRDAQRPIGSICVQARPQPPISQRIRCIDRSHRMQNAGIFATTRLRLSVLGADMLSRLIFDRSGSYFVNERSASPGLSFAPTSQAGGLADANLAGSCPTHEISPSLCHCVCWTCPKFPHDCAERRYLGRRQQMDHRTAGFQRLCHRKSQLSDCCAA
jgi:hypothetical protein